MSILFDYPGICKLAIPTRNFEYREIYLSAVQDVTLSFLLPTDDQASSDSTIYLQLLLTTSSTGSS